MDFREVFKISNLKYFICIVYMLTPKQIRIQEIHEKIRELLDEMQQLEREGQVLTEVNQNTQEVRNNANEEERIRRKENTIHGNNFRESDTNGLHVFENKNLINSNNGGGRKSRKRSRRVRR